VEILPVISPDGTRNLLLINKTGEKRTLANAKALMGGKASTVKAFCLDETTLQNPEASNTSNVIYSVDKITFDVPSDMELNPYGMVLLTNDIKM
jgi:hypothetical protein